MRTMTKVLLLSMLLTGGIWESAEAADRDVEELFTVDFAAAWKAGDAQALAALWVDDGTWMSMTGSRRVSTGREAIAVVWKVGLQGRDDPDRRAFQVEIEEVRFPTPGVAVVDVVMEFGSEEPVECARRCSPSWSGSKTYGESPAFEWLDSRADALVAAAGDGGALPRDPVLRPREARRRLSLSEAAVSGA